MPARRPKGRTARARLEVLEDRNAPAGLPDLTPQSISVVEPEVWQGDTVQIRYAVRNAGGAAAGPFAIDLRLGDTRDPAAAAVALGRVRVGGLAVGAVTTGTATVTLPRPADLPPGYDADAAYFVGAVIDPDGAVAEADEGNNAGGPRGVGYALLVVHPVLAEQEPNDTPATTQRQRLRDVFSSFRVNGRVNSADDRDFYRFLPAGNGSISVRVTSTTPVSLSLYDPFGELLVRSDGGDSFPSIDQQVFTGGDYLLGVEPLGGGVGDYQLQYVYTDDTVGPLRPHLTGGGANTSTVATADLNGDGVPDIITADENSGGVGIYLQGGNGATASTVRYATGDGPSAVVAADVDGDGAVDLVAANTNSHDLAVLLGNGDGTFRPARRFDAGDAPFDVAVADVDGDGAVDLVAADGGVFGRSGAVLVLPGNGDGTFRPARRLDAGDNPVRVAVADLNGDDAPDIVAAIAIQPSGEPGYVSVFLGSGGGAFGPAVRYAAGEIPQGVTIADADGDGTPDIVVADAVGGGSGAVQLLAGTGDGTFRPPVRVAVGPSPRHVVVRDVNGDDVPDLVVAAAGILGEAGGVGVALGRGDGTFAAPSVVRLRVANPAAVAVADLDRDGIPDIVAAVFAVLRGGGRETLFGVGDGTFRPGDDGAIRDDVAAVAAADLNGDGVTDVVTANTNSRGVAVLLGTGAGSYGLPKRTAAGDAPNEVRVADLNADGRLDVVVADGFAGRPGFVQVLIGNGDGTFPTGRRLPGRDVHDLGGGGRRQRGRGPRLARRRLHVWGRDRPARERRRDVPVGRVVRRRAVPPVGCGGRRGRGRHPGPDRGGLRDRKRRGGPGTPRRRPGRVRPPATHHCAGAEHPLVAGRGRPQRRRPRGCLGLGLPRQLLRGPPGGRPGRVRGGRPVRRGRGPVLHRLPDRRRGPRRRRPARPRRHRRVRQSDQRVLGERGRHVRRSPPPPVGRQPGRGGRRRREPGRAARPGRRRTRPGRRGRVCRDPARQRRRVVPEHEPRPDLDPHRRQPLPSVGRRRERGRPARRRHPGVRHRRRLGGAGDRRRPVPGGPELSRGDDLHLGRRRRPQLRRPPGPGNGRPAGRPGLGPTRERGRHLPPPRKPTPPAGSPSGFRSPISTGTASWTSSPPAGTGAWRRTSASCSGTAAGASPLRSSRRPGSRPPTGRGRSPSGSWPTAACSSPRPTPPPRAR